jgi:hypothetical protein
MQRLEVVRALEEHKTQRLRQIDASTDEHICALERNHRRALTASQARFDTKMRELDYHLSTQMASLEQERLKEKLKIEKTNTDRLRALYTELLVSFLRSIIALRTRPFLDPNFNISKDP